MNFMKSILIGIVIFLGTLSAFGQNNQGTPYSRYGIGLLPDNYGSYTAMGGVYAAMRDNYNVNFLNPASYTALDSMRFYFQLGVTGEYVDISTSKEDTDYQIAQNASINMAMRLYKKLFLSFGFNEKSDIGYDLYYNNNVNGDPSMIYLKHLEGEGGLNEAYLGLAYSLGKLSIGVNTALLFGKMEERQTLQILPATNGYYLKTRTQTHLHDVLFTIGAQYPLTLSDKSLLTLGTVFNFGTKLSGKQTFEAYKISNTSGITTTINNEEWEKGHVLFPFKLTVGGAYTYVQKWLFAGDYTYQRMSHYKEFGEGQEFKDYHHAALGVSYCPNENGRYWWQRNKYMAGAYFTKSHINLQNKDINTFGGTLGSQIPLQTTRQELLLGIAFDFGVRGTHDKNLLLEKYAKVRINVAFKEIWFMKRKIF